MFFIVPTVLAADLTVGPTGEYASPCEAIAAAPPGSTIEVDAAGTYQGESCMWSTEGLTIRGVNGRPVIDGAGADLTSTDAIFRITRASATLENLAFVGADGRDHYGSAVLHEGTDLVVRDCLFRDNAFGLSGAPWELHTGTVEVSGSEFVNNGTGSDLAPNIQLRQYAQVRVEGSWSHQANGGRLLYTSADQVLVVGSRFTDEEGGAASYELEFRHAGDVWIIGSLVEQAATTTNDVMVAYGYEGGQHDKSQLLHVVNSTFVNHDDGGTFLDVVDGGPAVVINSLLYGPGTLSSQAETAFVTSWDSSMGDPGLLDPDGYSYELSVNSPLVNAGSDPGVELWEYADPTGTVLREMDGSAWDIGAHEVEGGVGSDGDDSGDDDTGGTLKGGCGCGAGGAGVSAPALLLALAAGLGRRRGRASEGRQAGGAGADQPP